MKHLVFILFSLTFLYSCKSSIYKGTRNLNNNIFTDWYKNDFRRDNIPGISLNKVTSKLKSNNNTIVVAVLDTQIDADHEDLKSALWINKKEIPDNNIDDDHNGYVDDVNGWNFLGTKSGNYIVWANFEFIRIIREHDSIFKNKKKEEIDIAYLDKFDDYQKALIYKERFFQYYLNKRKSEDYNISVYHIAKDTLRYFFPKENYTLKQLDSLYRKNKINNKTLIERRDSNDRDLAALLDSFMTNLEADRNTFEDVIDYKEQMDSILNKNCNLEYNERKMVEYNPNVLVKGQGNNKINAKIRGIRIFSDHSTKVSSIIAADRKNNKGIEGFSDSIKIMPLSISPSGDEHDHDIAMAIRYAVDNGAKIINMSFTKEFSLRSEWVAEALQYAEKHNVLVVHIAGNDRFNIDNNPIYPNDYLYDGQSEVCSNFINVGSINKNYGEKMISSFSNYGKNNVDLFAPGEEIYTAIPDNQYGFDSGTSLAAPMVSGTAALIWLYYPKLTVQEVKQIILESGTSYDIEVIVPGTKDKKVKFSELSKTGKVLNVYNAMQMAKKMSERK
jgi:subtilisin family serine protease